MAKGENIEKPKKKTGLVLIIATGAKPKKDSVKKAEEPRKPRKRGRGRSRAQKEHFRQKMENNPFHLDDTLLRMKLPKEYFEGYLKNKHNMSIDEMLANEDLNIPQLLSEAKDFHFDMDNIHPNTLDLFQRRGIDVSDFQRDYKENPYMDFKERVNTLAQRAADDRETPRRKKAAAKQFKDGKIASGLKSKRLAELLERKGISVRQFYDSFLDKDTPLDLPFKERIDRLAGKPKPKNFQMPDFETELPDYYIPPSQQDDIDRDAEEEAHEQDMREREMNLKVKNEKGNLVPVYSQDEAEGIDERLLRFYLNLYSHHRNPMQEAMKSIRAIQRSGGLRGGMQLHSGKPEFPKFKVGGPAYLEPSTMFTNPFEESSVSTPEEDEELADQNLRGSEYGESYRRSEDKTSPIDAAMALLKSYSGSQRGNCDITRDDPLTGKSYGCKLFRGHDGPSQIGEEVQAPPIPDEQLNENPFVNVVKGNPATKDAYGKNIDHPAAMVYDNLAAGVAEDYPIFAAEAIEHPRLLEQNQGEGLKEIKRPHVLDRYRQMARDDTSAQMQQDADFTGGRNYGVVRMRRPEEPFPPES